MSEQTFDPDLDEVPPTRAQAAEARELLSENSTFLQAGRNLTKQYMRQFCELKPFLANGAPNLEFANQCMRANIMLNVIGDVIGHLAAMADHHKVDDDRTRRTMQNGAPR